MRNHAQVPGTTTYVLASPLTFPALWWACHDAYLPQDRQGLPTAEAACYRTHQHTPASKLAGLHGASQKQNKLHPLVRF